MLTSFGQGDLAGNVKGEAMKILPDDPLVRWLIYLCGFVSIGAPVLLALVLMIS